jgi:GR25 family glycosyltransferase involved in LPS biosynthesis
MEAYIINLEHRKDRRAAVEQEVLKLDLEKYTVISALTGSNPGEGCTLSHQYCVQLAKENDLEYVLILEDDVIFEENVQEVFNKAFREVQAYPWNILYLGCNVKGSVQKVEQNLGKVVKANTTHAYVIHKRFYDTVLGIDDYSVIIDLQYRQLSYKYDMFTCIPLVAFQRPNHSDILNIKVDYKKDMERNFKINLK